MAHPFSSCIFLCVLLLIQSQNIHTQDPSLSPSSSPLPSSSVDVCRLDESSGGATLLSRTDVWKTENNPKLFVHVAKFAVNRHNKCGSYKVQFDKTIQLSYQNITDATVYNLLIRGTTSEASYGSLFEAVVNWMPLVNKMTLLLWNSLLNDDLHDATCAFLKAPKSTYNFPGKWNKKANPNDDSLLVELAKLVVNEHNRCHNAVTYIEDAILTLPSLNYSTIQNPHPGQDIDLDIDPEPISLKKYESISLCEYQSFDGGDNLFRFIVHANPYSSNIKAVVYWEPSQKRKTIIYSD